MSRFFSNELKNLVPYTPGEQLEGNYIKLNTNESPFPPSPNVLKIINDNELNRLNLYSDPTCSALVNSIADFYGVDNRNVAVGNGSDEILAFAFRAFGEHGFICPSITYGFYPVFADFFCVELDIAPMNKDLSIDCKALMESKRNIIIANPNAQTGTYLDIKDIEKIVSSNKERLVIVDEAYIDFGGKSAVSLINKYDNILVVQTFSKSRNLAGGRIGFAVGCEELIKDINTMKFSFNPYNVNRLSILAGAESMKDKEYFEQCTNEIIKTREYFKSELKALNFEYINSLSNFVLTKHKKMSGKELYLELKDNGFLVRYLGGDISDYIRITIGTKEQMNKLLDCLKTILREYF